MAYNMILTPEQEQRRKDSKQALESLKYNPMCYGCRKLCAGCDGTTKKAVGRLHLVRENRFSECLRTGNICPRTD